MNRIKSLRMGAGIKQVLLAKHLSVAPSVLSNWENGKFEPDVSNLKKIAKYFNTTIDYIVGMSNDPIPSERKNKQFKNPNVLLLQKALENGMPENELEDVLGYAKYRFPERFK